MILLLLSPAFVFASPPATHAAHAGDGRPKIGLALEGGGALGLAHIGVLQWFEDHHVPVDYIAGTSMGGLVGGLYATGRSPREMEQLVQAQNWDIILGGAAPYQDLSFRRKEDLRAYPTSLVIGLKHGLALPSALNAGQEISLLIDRETLAYSTVTNFDDLPIPFRCVATDLVAGKEAVFQSGSLATAMRATMSLPGIFSPVRDGEHVYVDGGLVANLPTDVVRAMGADIVIAVHLETAPAQASDIRSLFSVLGRSIDVVVAENEVRGLAGADLVVRVPLQEYTSLDYTKSKDIIRRGTAAAEDKSRILSPYQLDDAAWNAYLDARRAREKPAVYMPQFIEVQGTGGDAQKTIERFLRGFVGQPLDIKLLERRLTALTGLGRYDTAGYQLIHRGEQQGLLITVHEKNFAPPQLQPAFEVDGSEANDVNFTFGARATFLDMAGYRSEWRTDVLFGNTYGVESELYKPFRRYSNWFFSPHAGARDTSFKIYEKSDPIADYRLVRAYIGGDAGYGFSRFTEWRVGYDVGSLDARLRLGRAAFASVSGRVGAAHLRFLSDHTDDPVIPRRGYYGEMDFRAYDTSPGATGWFPEMKMDLRYFQPVSKPASIFVTAEGGSTFGFQGTGIPQFFLGGPSRLSAYGTNEFMGNQYFTGRAGYLHSLFTLPPFVGKRVYATATWEFGKMYGSPTASAFPNDFAAGVVAETALGPFFIGGSAGDSGHRKWFFQIGKVF
jgi:NTE family protein